MYKVLVEQDLDHLEKEVSNHLKQGWKLQGPVQLGAYDNGVQIWFQTLTREGCAAGQKLMGGAGGLRFAMAI